MRSSSGRWAQRSAGALRGCKSTDLIDVGSWCKHLGLVAVITEGFVVASGWASMFGALLRAFFDRRRGRLLLHAEAVVYNTYVCVLQDKRGAGAESSVGCGRCAIVQDFSCLM